MFNIFFRSTIHSRFYCALSLCTFGWCRRSSFSARWITDAVCFGNNFVRIDISIPVLLRIYYVVKFLTCLLSRYVFSCMCRLADFKAAAVVPVKLPAATFCLWYSFLCSLPTGSQIYNFYRNLVASSDPKPLLHCSFACRNSRDSEYLQWHTHYSGQIYCFIDTTATLFTVHRSKIACQGC